MVVINKHSKRVTDLKKPGTYDEYIRDIKLLQCMGQVQLSAIYRKHYAFLFGKGN